MSHRRAKAIRKQLGREKVRQPRLYDGTNPRYARLLNEKGEEVGEPFVVACTWRLARDTGRGIYQRMKRGRA